MSHKKLQSEIHPVVWVKWLDASAEKGPVRRQELDREFVLVTAGFLVEDDDVGVSIAQDYIAKQGTYRDVEHIPKSYILDRSDKP